MKLNPECKGLVVVLLNFVRVATPRSTLGASAVTTGVRFSYEHRRRLPEVSPEGRPKLGLYLRDSPLHIRLKRSATTNFTPLPEKGTNVDGLRRDDRLFCPLPFLRDGYRAGREPYIESGLHV